VHNDLISAVDQGNVGALALLDLSSAFDTVDHSLLLAILQKRFAVTNSALAWFQSYLADRTQTVHLQAQVSNTIHIDCGVLQGSVLGPKTFIAYVDEMEDIFVAHGLHYHAFADDTQTYTDVPLSHSTTVAPRLRNCIADVVDSCGAHRPQLNASKTYLLWYGSSAALLQSLSLSEKNIVVGGDTIVPADVGRDLGVQFDCELNIVCSHRQDHTNMFLPHPASTTDSSLTRT